MQNSSDEGQLEKAIVALHTYCGYAAGPVQEFFSEVLHPAIHSKEVWHGALFKNSAPHVIAALHAAPRLVSYHTAVNQPRNLQQFTGRLVNGIHRPSVLYAIVSDLKSVDTLGVCGCKTVLRSIAVAGLDALLAGPGDTPKPKEQVFKGLVAHIKRVIRRQPTRSCPGCMLRCLSSLAGMGCRSARLSADVQKAFGLTLYSQAHMGDKTDSVCCPDSVLLPLVCVFCHTNWVKHTQNHFLVVLCSR